MDSLPVFTTEQFSTRPAIPQMEAELKKWLRQIAVEERGDFIARLWAINYPLALILVQSSQLPVKEIEALLRKWLAAGHNNAAQKSSNIFR